MNLTRSLMKRLLRTTIAMDSLPIDEAKADLIVDEANDAFGKNMIMFKELEGNLIKAIGIQVFNMLTRRNRGGNELATAK
jgi:heme oxygenase (biliverdin-producing, ferredoxin)